MFALLVALKTALTVYVVPYNALGGELSDDYDERSSIQAARATFYLLGMAVAIAGALVLFFRSTPAYARGQLNPAAYPAMGRAFAALALAAAALCFAATVRFIPGLVRALPPPERPAATGSLPRTIARTLAAALRNRDFRMLALNIFIIEAGLQLGIAISVHTNTYTYGLTGPRIAALTAVLFAWQPFWVWVAKRFDKRTALVAGTLIALVGFVGAPWTHVWWHWFPLGAASLPLTLGLFQLFAGLGNGAYASIPYSMVADTVDEAELETGRRDEAVYFGLYTFAYKIGAAVSLTLSGLVLDWVGFDPALAVQQPRTTFGLAMIPSWVLVLAAPPALYCLFRYTFTRERYEAVQARLRELRALRGAA